MKWGTDVRFEYHIMSESTMDIRRFKEVVEGMQKRYQDEVQLDELKCMLAASEEAMREWCRANNVMGYRVGNQWYRVL